MWTKFFPAVLEVRRLIEAGTIGDAVSVHADFAFSDDPDADGGGIPRIWRRDHAGGGLLDVGIYPLAMASMVFGGRKPASVVATGALRGGIDATGGAVLRYKHVQGGDGCCDGLDGVAVLSWGVRSETEGNCFIAGTKGSIKIPSPMHCPNRIILTTTSSTTTDDDDSSNDTHIINNERTTRTIEFPLPAALPDAPDAADDASYFFRNSRGFAYEAAEVWRCVVNGQKECPTHTLRESILLAETMDDIRRQMVRVIWFGYYSSLQNYRQQPML